MRHKLVGLLGRMTAVLLCAQPATAQFGFPIINNVTVDYANKTLTVIGSNFGAGPTVTLGTTVLTVQGTPSSTKITVGFPAATPLASFAPGDYFLKVAFTNELFAIFEVTLGAVGPQGLQGPPGVNGKDGAPGPQGPQGIQGSQGPSGRDGTNGTNGAPGANGDSIENSVTPPTTAECSAGGQAYDILDGSGAVIPGTRRLVCNGQQGPAGSSNGWSLTGNAGTVPGTNFIGTTDNQPVEIWANGARVIRAEPAVASAQGNIAPNVIGGGAGNTVAARVQGATVFGGGTTFAGSANNSVAYSFGVYPDFATVLGGFGNTASGYIATIVGGSENEAGGIGATAVGGELNAAFGRNSFAAGTEAQSRHDGAFVWADDASSFPFGSVAANEFAVRALGGVRFVTGLTSGNPAAGVQLAAGGSAWASISDRSAKENFAPVDTRTLLDRLAAIPMQTWNYKTQAATIRHIGPMAQDFFAAFNVGEDDKHITTIDADGVSLAAIQGLYNLVRDQQAQIAALKAQVRELRRERE